MLVFSIIVPFQMVMYTMTYVANRANLDNLFGITFVYLGFGAGLSVFMLCGFIKSIPLEIEEAAMIDGASPIQAFFTVVFPMLKPTAITVAILNTMWIWNDYLLPYLVLGSDKKTIPVAIQLAMQRLRLNRLRRLYGNACACDCANNYFLYFLPKIYYKRRCCRRS